MTCRERERNTVNDKWFKTTATILLLVLVAVVSCVFLADRLAAPEIYKSKVASIDEKAETVLKLTASATVASAGITAIPGDTATPIAQKLADFSEYFLIILCVLYSEKYLMALIPAGVCRYLVPFICGVFIVGILSRKRTMVQMGYKLLAVALGVALIIPMSIGASDMIYNAYRESIETTIEAASELTNETNELAEAEDKGVINSILDRISETTESLTKKASNILNRFVETLAVMIVTSCVIPMVVLLFFLWIINKITGIDLRDYVRMKPDRRRVHSDAEDGLED